jgi:hypothetical protein
VTLDDLKRLFTPRAILNLEREVEYLRGHNNMLLLQLREMSAPKLTAPTVKREFPKFTPARTSWESYLAEEIAKQEREDQDGAHSG